jgi:hypothetical protein
MARVRDIALCGFFNGFNDAMQMQIEPDGAAAVAVAARGA